MYWNRSRIQPNMLDNRIEVTVPQTNYTLIYTLEGCLLCLYQDADDYDAQYLARLSDEAFTTLYGTDNADRMLEVVPITQMDPDLILSIEEFRQALQERLHLPLREVATLRDLQHYIKETASKCPPQQLNGIIQDTARLAHCFDAWI